MQVQRELNEALASRFVVIQMPPLAKEDLERLLKDQFPSLVTKYNKQFALLFNELQKKCENGELTEKALDLRGLIDAISLIKRVFQSGMHWILELPIRYLTAMKRAYT